MIQFDEFAHIFSTGVGLIQPTKTRLRGPLGRFSRHFWAPQAAKNQVAKALGGEIFTFDGGHDVPMDEVPSGIHHVALGCCFFSVRKPRNW